MAADPKAEMGPDRAAAGPAAPAAVRDTAAPKIADVRAFAVVYPEPHDGNNLRSLCFARVETADGHVGWGEAITGLPEASRAVKLLIEDAYAEMLVGEDPTLIGQHLARLRRRSFWYGTGGLATMAISALDIALWDVTGRIWGVPVHKLLGGKLTDRVELCASVIWDAEDLDFMAEWFASFRERGYRWTKAGWGRKPAEAAFGLDPEKDIAMARTAREALGPDVRLSLDVTIDANWSVAHAIRMAKRLAECDIAWLEDALDFEDVHGYARLRRAAPMAIAAGEREWRAPDYQDLFDAEAVDIVLIDPGRVEGISGMRAAAQLAAQARVRFVPHSWSSAVNTAAALAVFCSQPNGHVFELEPDPSPMQHELVSNPFENENGYLAIRDDPGLGVEVDESVLRAYELR